MSNILQHTFSYNAPTSISYVLWYRARIVDEAYNKMVDGETVQRSSNLVMKPRYSGMVTAQQSVRVMGAFGRGCVEGVYR